MYNIDIKTMLIVLILGHFLTAIFVVSYTGSQKRSKAINVYLISKLLQTVAWVMLLLRGIIDSMFLISIGNAVLFTGAAMELTAFMILKGYFTKKVKRYYMGFLLFSIIVFILVTLLKFGENIRIALASAITAILIAFPLYRLSADKKSSRLQKVIATNYALILLFGGFRTIASLTHHLDMNLESTSIYNTGLFFVLYLVLITGSTGFLLLDKESQDYELLKAATFDELTKVLNRKTFIAHSKDSVSLCEKRQEKISLLLIDIDDFKKVNDKYGHFIGDKVLQDFASNIKKQLRDCDLFGRYGGEEFAILLPRTDEKEAEETAEHLRLTIEKSSVDAQLKVKYTISIGFLSVLPNEKTDWDTLYKLCDKALYLAKSQGKNCCKNAIEIHIEDEAVRGKTGIVLTPEK